MAARFVCLEALGIVGQIITHVHTKYKYNNIPLAWFLSLSALQPKHCTNHHFCWEESSLGPIKFDAFQLQFLHNKMEVRDEVTDFFQIMDQVFKFLEFPVQVVTPIDIFGFTRTITVHYLLVNCLILILNLLQILSTPVYSYKLPHLLAIHQNLAHVLTTTCQSRDYLGCLDHWRYYISARINH